MNSGYSPKKRLKEKVIFNKNASEGSASVVLPT